MQEVDTRRVYLLLHLPGFPPSILLREGNEGFSLINAEVKRDQSPISALKDAVSRLASPNMDYTIDCFARGVEPVGFFSVCGGKTVQAYCAVAQTSGVSLIEKVYGRQVSNRSRLAKGAHWVGLDYINLHHLDPYSTKIISDFDELYRYLKPESDYLSSNNGWGVIDIIKKLNGSLRKVALESKDSIPTRTLWENVAYLWETRDERRTR